MKKAPRWTVAFLRALERTGEARAAAVDAGVDHSTAYARRRSHPDFAHAWAAALEAHAAEKARVDAEEIEALQRAPSTIHSSVDGPPPHAGEELVGVGSRMKRAGNGRWSQAREKIFFEELAATNNVRRSAAAAGVSANAVFARRLKHPVFAAKWDAVARTASAAIGMHLLEESRKSFDPDELDTGDVTPKVTVAEAIRIVQLHGTKTQKEELLGDPFREQAASMREDEVAEIRERLIRKLRRMRERDMPDMIAQGWSFDEAYDHMVPPGWVRAED
jgi:hypothetical protein